MTDDRTDGAGESRTRDTDTRDTNTRDTNTRDTDREHGVEESGPVPDGSTADRAGDGGIVLPTDDAQTTVSDDDATVVSTDDTISVTVGSGDPDQWDSIVVGSEDPDSSEETEQSEDPDDGTATRSEWPDMTSKDPDEDELRQTIEGGMTPDLEREYILIATDSPRADGPTAPDLMGLGEHGLDPRSTDLQAAFEEPTGVLGHLDGREAREMPEQDSRNSIEADQPATLEEAARIGTVGADLEADLLAASDPDLGLVDMDAIGAHGVGGTIDGRTPDGGADGGFNQQGFGATTGWTGGDLLAGANEAGTKGKWDLTEQELDKIIAKIHEAQALEAETGESHSVTYNGYTYYGKGATAENQQLQAEANQSTSPAMAKVVSTDSSGEVTGISGGGGGTGADSLNIHANQLLKQLDDEHDQEFGKPGGGAPSNKESYDPELFGSGAPINWDIHDHWVNHVDGIANSTINPDRMAESAEPPPVMQIDSLVEQYEGPVQATPSVESAQAMLDAHKDSIGEQFGDLGE